jgi:hypothetical protein
MLKRLGIWLLLLLVIVAALVIGTKYFIQPMDTDLSVVGQGKPSLVLAYENFSPDSGATLNQLTRVKKDYQQYMNFVVADLGAPQGRAFAGRHNLVNGMVVFFSGSGEALRLLRLPNEEQGLRELLDQQLALVGISR